ncbi:class I SAM-dependent methyltransferase [Streptomyces sp. AJS327]|uniref:class I SAM-dependent methyltransferase n=1 Tax=Streptomyces sp. AJS327 TaxID=2545265 RepID=UPI0015DF40A0|nr:class I SAM-dependent methyltransferase [Streptomyces sp. AJS327]MBA0051163.1 class I SAM-dependent methyltransferase [Streptomyces sp. AJS327]
MAKPQGRPARDGVHHPWFAWFYARISRFSDLRAGVAEHREELLAGLSGQVVEIGAGNGRNFARYPETVTRVIAVEPEPHMRALAREAARNAPVPVEVVPGTADALPLADSSVDAAVVCLVLCTIPDGRGALRELRRALRPEGELRFYEHGRAEGRPGMLRTQRALDRGLWPALFGGCHTGRDPVGLVRSAGFTDLSFRRTLVTGGGPALPSSFHYLGSARRP